MAVSLDLGIKALAEAIAAKINGLMSRINPSVSLTADRTMTDADSGKSFVYNGTGTITVTIPATVSVGFYCRIENASTGQVLISAPATIQFGNASRTGLRFQWDVVEVEIKTISDTRIVDLIYNLALPVTYAENTAAVTRNVVAMSAIPGLTLGMEANSAYDVDIIVPFTSANATNSLKIGLLALPTGATCALEVTVWTSDTAGASSNWKGLLMSSARAVTGVAANASTLSVVMMARISGRIRTGAAEGQLAVAAGALNTAGVQTIAANAASMSLSKVYDQGRT